MLGAMAAPWPFLAIVRRELLVSMRLKRHFAFLALLIAIAGFVIAVNWPRDNSNFFAESTYMARALVFSFIFTLQGAVALFMPAMASSAFVSERENDTFDMLRLTMVSPSGLILAKLMSTTGLFFLMIWATLPVMGAVFFLIGLDIAQVAIPFLMILASSVSCGMIGIYCSAKFQKSIPATAVAFLMVAFIMGGWMLLLVFAIDLIDLDDWVVVPFIISCPFGIIILALEGSPPIRGINIETLYALAFAFHGLISLWAFWRTRRILRRAQNPIHSPCGERNQRFPIWRRLEIAGVVMLAALIPAVMCLGIMPRLLLRASSMFTPMLALVATLGYMAAILFMCRWLIRRFRQRRATEPAFRRKKLIGDNQNPMLVKELYWAVFHRKRFMIRTFYLSFIVVLLFAVPFYEDTSHGWQSPQYRPINEEVILLCLVQTIALLVAAPVFLTNTFTKEYALGNLDMLRMTLLRPRSIIFGKSMAALGALLPIGLSITLTTLAGLFVYGPNWPTLVATACAFTTLAVNVLVALAICMFVSVLTRRTGPALITSYIVGLAVCLGLPLGAVLLVNLTRMRGNNDAVIAALSPTGAPLGLLEYKHNFQPWLISMVVYTAASLLLIWLATRIFARRRA